MKLILVASIACFVSASIAAQSAVAGIARAPDSTPLCAHVAPRVALVLDVHPVVLARDDAQLWIDGSVATIGARELVGDLELWSGRVAGDASSSVFLGLSRHGSRGWIEQGGRTWHLVAEPDVELGWEHARSRWIDGDTLELRAIRACAASLPPSAVAIDALPHAPTTLPRSSSLAALAAAPVLPLYECRLALETDYQYYAKFNDVAAAKTYALQVLGAVSARFREQVGTVITLPYVGLHTQNNDAWTKPDIDAAPIDILQEFSDTWTTGLPVAADLAHLMSGSSAGGGAGWLASLCEADYCHGVSTAVDLQQVFPPVPYGLLNNDFGLAAHEIGHGFGAIHTHEYCPPLDQCSPWWGQCQTAQVCTSEGTLMSYCTFCAGGQANITTYFHAQSVADMRAFVLDSCLQRWEGLDVTPLGHALAGSAGTPAIQANWSKPLDQLSFAFNGYKAPTQGFLVFGLTALNVPVFGGVLVPAPTLVLGFPAPTSSSTAPALQVTGTFPSGVHAIAQGWFVDVASPNLVSATQGIDVELVVPDPLPAPTWFTNPANGHQYALTSVGSWYHCHGEAVAHGAQLVSIGSAAEEAWLKTTFYDSSLAQGALWIGLTDAFSEGAFHWLDGTPYGYHHFPAGEPNDGSGYSDVAYWWWGGVWYSAFGYYWFAGQRGLMER